MGEKSKKAKSKQKLLNLYFFTYIYTFDNLVVIMQANHNSTFFFSDTNLKKMGVYVD